MLDQAFVEVTCGIVSGIRQLDVQGGHFNQAGEITPRPDWNRHVGDFLTQDADKLLFHPDAVHILDIFPVLQCDDQLDAFAAADASNPEHRSGSL